MHIILKNIITTFSIIFTITCSGLSNSIEYPKPQHSDVIQKMLATDVYLLSFNVDLCKKADTEDNILQCEKSQWDQFWQINTITTTHIKDIVYEIKYRINLIPSDFSYNDELRWKKFFRLLHSLQITAKNNPDVFINYLEQNQNTLKTTLANLGFTINTFPHEENIWKTIIGNKFLSLIFTLHDLQYESNVENTAFGHLSEALEVCQSDDQFKNILIQLKTNDWLSIARISHFILRCINPTTSKTDAQIDDRLAISRDQLNEHFQSFLQNEDNLVFLYQMLSHVLKKMRILELYYWRYKAIEYIAGIIYSIELDYQVPILEKMTVFNKQALAINAQLFNWAIVVENFCPSATLRIFSGYGCFSPPRRTRNPEVIKAVSIWHQSDQHPISLFPPQTIFILSQRLAIFADLDFKELILDFQSIYESTLIRLQSESKSMHLKFLNFFEW